MTYQEIIERVVRGVVKDNPNPPPLDRLRMAAETHFSPVLNLVSESFAGREDNRLLMKQNVTLTFASGTATLPANVLLKYLKDARLIVAVSSGAKQTYSYQQNYGDFVRCQDQSTTPDNRLGYWAVIGTTIYGVTPTNLAALDASLINTTVLDAACVPDVPAASTTEFAGPAQMVPELINALIETLRGKDLSTAAEAAA